MNLMTGGFEHAHIIVSYFEGEHKIVRQKLSFDEIEKLYAVLQRYKKAFQSK